MNFFRDFYYFEIFFILNLVWIFIILDKWALMKKFVIFCICFISLLLLFWVFTIGWSSLKQFLWFKYWTRALISCAFLYYFWWFYLSPYKMSFWASIYLCPPPSFLQNWDNQIFIIPRTYEILIFETISCIWRKRLSIWYYTKAE